MVGTSASEPKRWRSASPEVCNALIVRTTSMPRTWPCDCEGATCVHDAGDEVTQQIAARFRRFAEVEARGSSPLYEALALGVAADAFALKFLERLPEAKRQPNLLFAA